MRETFVAVVTTNLPMIFPLVKTFLVPIFGSLLTSKRSTHKLDGTPKDTRTFGGSGGQSWRGRGPPTANPLTNVTFSESEERMVENGIHMHDIKTWSESDSGNPPSSNNNNNGGNDKNIRKCVEIAVVREERTRKSTDHRGTMPADEESLPVQGHFAFARGPHRTSFHAGNQI